MKQVEGKVAFITGGASGIGFGMAQCFSSSGIEGRHRRHSAGASRRGGARPRPKHQSRLPLHQGRCDRSGGHGGGSGQEAERVFGKVPRGVQQRRRFTAICRSKAPATEDWDWVPLGVNLGGVINGVGSVLCPR